MGEVIEAISYKEMIQEIKKYFIEHSFEEMGKTDKGISIFEKKGENNGFAKIV